MGCSYTRPLTFALVCLLFLTSACATDSQPEAAKPAAETQAEPPLSRASSVIHVTPVFGMSNPLRLVLADAVAASLRDAERPAILADQPNNQGPSIRPFLEQVRERGSVVWVSTRWELLAPYGTVVAERKRQMVIDRTLWDRESVEAVNLIIDDAMPAVAAMVHDFVGPAEGGSPVETETAFAPSAEEVASGSEAAPILGRAPENPEALPAGVGAPAPPPALENLVLDLPQVAETENEVTPGPSDAPKPAPASRPPLVLAPGAAPVQPNAETMAKRSGQPETMAAPDFGGLTAEEQTAEPPSSRATQPTVAPQVSTARSEPEPLTAPRPPDAIAGIEPAPRDTPVRWGKPAFLVRTVSGAPGDGNKALGLAITTALRAKDLTVTEDPRQAGYEVVGKVEVGPAVNGRQRARITWAVNTMGGEEIGKAVQENVVASGSLNGNWGRVAVLVSSAAANGIQQLFDAPRPKYTPVGTVPQFPKIPQLPRVPGRALPPPS